MEKNKDKVLVLDVDGTICEKRSDGKRYSELQPNKLVLEKINQYRKKGYYIILYTSRNMNTYNNNTGLINANTAKVMLKWLDDNEIEYDEIYFAKPWCGFNGFYVDDKTIRPDEFLRYSPEEIAKIVGNN